jgi:hypothetical protein
MPHIADRIGKALMQANGAVSKKTAPEQGQPCKQRAKLPFSTSGGLMLKSSDMNDASRGPILPSEKYSFKILKY